LSDEQIEKILRGNWLRIFEDCRQSASYRAGAEIV